MIKSILKLGLPGFELFDLGIERKGVRAVSDRQYQFVDLLRYSIVSGGDKLCH